MAFREYKTATNIQNISKKALYYSKKLLKLKH